MAADQQERRDETGEERQQRIQREQHRPEQEAGYDEAVRQPRSTDEKSIPPDQRPRRDV